MIGCVVAAMVSREAFSLQKRIKASTALNGGFEG